MSALRRFAVLLSAVAAALITLLTLQTPAFAADDVSVSLRGLAGTTTPTLPATLQVTYTNTTTSEHVIVSVITVELDNMPAGAVHLQRFGAGEVPGEAGDPGTVTFTDPTTVTLSPRGKQQVNYFLTFGADTPNGQATVTASAVEDGDELGSDDASTRIGAGAGKTTKTTAPNTNPGFVPTFEAGPTYSLAPLQVADQATPGSASVPKTLYILGSMLVIMGAVTLVLIFRPTRGWRAAGARAAQVAWHPRGTREGGPQQWPMVGRPDQRRPYDPGRGRAVRDPGPGDNLPPWQRP